MIRYEVRPGDTLEGIADYYDVSVEAILAANKNLSQDNMPAGTVIIIPVSWARKMLRSVFGIWR